MNPAAPSGLSCPDRISFVSGDRENSEMFLCKSLLGAPFPLGDLALPQMFPVVSSLSKNRVTT